MGRDERPPRADSPGTAPLLRTMRATWHDLACGCDAASVALSAAGVTRRRFDRERTVRMLVGSRARHRLEGLGRKPHLLKLMQCLPAVAEIHHAAEAGGGGLDHGEGEIGRA